MGQMLKALRQIEARSPQPAVEDVAASEPLIARAIETVETAAEAVAEANAACVREEEQEVKGGSATATPTTTATATPTTTATATPTTTATAAPTDPLAAIAERICAQCSPRAGKVLMFTSPDDEAADGGLMAPLAAALAARIGGDVLLLDGNPQQPDLVGQLGVQAVAGLGDVLRGAVPWHEAIQATSVPGLFLLPGRGLSQFSPQRTEGDSPIFAGARTGSIPTPFPVPLPMSTLLGELSAKFRMVLIAAPSLARPGVANVTRHCRGTYLVVRLHRTSRRAVRAAARAIDRGGGRLLGCAVIEPTAPAAPSDW
jgi:Mrp family chromosome partitioning ATPase